MPVNYFPSLVSAPILSIEGQTPGLAPGASWAFDFNGIVHIWNPAGDVSTFDIQAWSATGGVWVTLLNIAAGANILNFIVDIGNIRVTRVGGAGLWPVRYAGWRFL